MGPSVKLVLPIIDAFPDQKNGGNFLCGKKGQTKIFQKSENLPKIWKSSKNLSDQMSQRSQVSRIALCMSKLKVLWVTDWVSEWQSHPLSCSGQLKRYKVRGVDVLVGGKDRHMIFVNCTTCGTGVKFFSMVSKYQELTL